MAGTRPIACSLDAAEARDRLARIEALGRRALLTREEGPGLHVLRFATDPGASGELEEIVRAERRCCPFLDLALGEEGGELVLTIGAGPDAALVATMLAEAFGPAHGARAERGREWAGRRLPAGLGAGAALALLCCVGAPLLVGGALASAVGGAGDAVLVLGAVAAGVHALRRRRSRREGCDC